MSKRFRIDIEHTFFAHEQEDFEGARQNILNNVSVDDLHELIINSTVIEIDEGGNEIAMEDK